MFRFYNQGELSHGKNFQSLGPIKRSKKDTHHLKFALLSGGRFSTSISCCNSYRRNLRRLGKQPYCDQMLAPGMLKVEVTTTREFQKLTRIIGQNLHTESRRIPDSHANPPGIKSLSFCFQFKMRARCSHKIGKDLVEAMPENDRVGRATRLRRSAAPPAEFTLLNLTQSELVRASRNALLRHNHKETVSADSTIVVNELNGYSERTASSVTMAQWNTARSSECQNFRPGAVSIVDGCDEGVDSRVRELNFATKQLIHPIPKSTQ